MREIQENLVVLVARKHVDDAVEVSAQCSRARWRAQMPVPESAIALMVSRSRISRSG